MFLLTISETTVGLSLSVNTLTESSSCAEYKYVKNFNNALSLLNPKRMKNMHFCPKGHAFASFHR